MNKINTLPVKPQALPICLVCGEPIKEGWDHVLINEKGSPFLVPKDKPHAVFAEAVIKSNYSLPCFCGGHITIHGTGEDSWETTCDICGYMWDED